MKLSDFLEEAAIMKEMKHPNLVQVTTIVISVDMGNIAHDAKTVATMHTGYCALCNTEKGL